MWRLTTVVLLPGSYEKPLNTDIECLRLVDRLMLWLMEVKQNVGKKKQIVIQKPQMFVDEEMCLASDQVK